MLSVGNLKLPAMPRTGDDSILQLSFGERAALMRTNSVDRVKLTSVVEQRHDPPGDGEFSAATRRHIVHSGEYIPLGDLV